MSADDRDQSIQKLATMIKGIRVAMLTTEMPDGSLRSRPMATQTHPFDGTLWFFCGAESAKVYEVRGDHNVNLAYADPSENRYASVTGTASLVHDRVKAEELWNPAYKAWFPKGLDDPDLALLRVDVEQAEYWDSPASAVVHVIGFVKAIATGQRYHPGENEKLNLQDPARSASSTAVQHPGSTASTPRAEESGDSPKRHGDELAPDAFRTDRSAR